VSTSELQPQFKFRSLPIDGHRDDVASGAVQWMGSSLWLRRRGPSEASVQRATLATPARCERSTTAATSSTRWFLDY
jgi:hypothetical protein